MDMRSSQKAPIGRLLALSVLLLSPATLQAKGGPCDPLTGFCQYICGIDTLFLNFDANPGHVSYDIFIDGVQFFDDELVTAPVTQLTLVDPPDGVVNIEIVTTCGDGSTMTSNCLLAIAPPVAPPGTDLIIVKEGATTGDPGLYDSATSLEEALTALGRQPVRRSYNDFTAFVNEGCLNLMEWDVVWVISGDSVENTTLSSTEGDLLADRVAAGLPTYLEGRDHWTHAPPSDLDLFDGVLIAAPTAALVAFDGFFDFPTFVEPFVNFPEASTAPLSAVTSVAPTAEVYVPGLFDILGVYSPPLFTTSLEFGGYFIPSPEEVAYALLSAFGEVDCSLLVDPISLIQGGLLVLWTPFGEATVEATFDPPVTGPVQVASTDGGFTLPITEFGPGGVFDVTLEQTCLIAGDTPDPIELQVEIPCTDLGVTLTCALGPGGVELTASGPIGDYASVVVWENGVPIGALSAGQTSLVHPAVAGFNTYELALFCPGMTVPLVVGTCYLDVPCSGVTGLQCTNSSGSTVDLSWSNHFSNDQVVVYRDGTLIAVLDPSETTYSDTTAPAGQNNYEVMGLCVGFPTPSAVCSIILGTEYIRGDCNVDGNADVGDAVAALAVLFTGGTTSCQDACNVNGDAAVDIADAIYLLSYLFSGGAEPPAPFPECGIAEQLGCDAGPSCLSTR